jgi:O-antigen chain-terminating methyltransferase
MIESHIPEIDVEELHKRVQAEAERLRNLPQRPRTGGVPPVTLRTPAPLRAAPKVTGPVEFDTGRERLNTLHGLLDRAREATEVRSVPKPFRWLFRKQARYNSLLIQSVIPLFESVLKLIHWQQIISADFVAQSRWLAELSNARSEDTAWMRTAARLVQSLTDAAAGLEQRVRELTDRVQDERNTLRQDLILLEQRYTNDAAFIKAELALTAALIRRRLNDGTPSGADAPVSTPAERARPAGEEHGLDAFYLSFENRFRGTREEIKNRQRFYLPLLRAAAAGTEDRPILDLGCGRGEWLELLAQQKLTATGIDLNMVMVTQCTERSLNAVHADAVEWLRGLADNSQGAISGFHIIEHLPLEILMDLLRETFRVLHPSGVAIFESPNCKNLVVGACNFNIDPTHQRPVFPDTAQFMLEAIGFGQVRLEYLSPVETHHLEGVADMPVRLRELLYGPQDFAVIGYKPG